MNLRDKLSEYRRKILRWYLQNLNPALGKTVEMINEPRNFFTQLLPINMAKWLAIAAAVITGLLLLNPELFWSWQITIFVAVFFLGPTIRRLFIAMRSTFYNLLVAYPGKHLLGHAFLLKQAIDDGMSEIKLHGEKWTIKGDDCPAGKRVRVIAVKKDVLFVTAE